eukprot:gb/GECG01000351.1/.p1 GENE.gb/GECG01000351.1/~~gb/GECG01000351.1/.p1  ORF type:complete len:179 (+),score=20.71 gb/GECG01000351.1/:1-537(+)
MNVVHASVNRVDSQLYLTPALCLDRSSLSSGQRMWLRCREWRTRLLAQPSPLVALYVHKDSKPVNTTDTTTPGIPPNSEASSSIEESAGLSSAENSPTDRQKHVFRGLAFAKATKHTRSALIDEAKAERLRQNRNTVFGGVSKKEFAQTLSYGNLASSFANKARKGQPRRPYSRRGGK